MRADTPEKEWESQYDQRFTNDEKFSVAEG